MEFSVISRFFTEGLGGLIYSSFSAVETVSSDTDQCLLTCGRRATRQGLASSVFSRSEPSLNAWATLNHPPS
jgi:hypothetical protein